MLEDLQSMAACVNAKSFHLSRIVSPKHLKLHPLCMCMWPWCISFGLLRACPHATRALQPEASSLSIIGLEHCHQPILHAQLFISHMCVQTENLVSSGHPFKRNSHS